MPRELNSLGDQALGARVYRANIMPKPICSPLGRSVELRANYAPLDVRLDVILDPQPLEEVEDDHFISLTGYNVS